MLYLTGLGLDVKGISVKGFEILKKCESIYLEGYTSKFPIKEFEKFIGKNIKVLFRKEVEENPEFLKEAVDKDVVFLVPGDPMVATTHADLILRAEKLGVKTKVIHSSSIYSAVGETGLFIYKTRAISIPIWEENYNPESFFEVLEQNKKLGLHTLFLLDYKPEEKKLLKIKQAIEILLEINQKRKEKIFDLDTMVLGIARLGRENQIIKYGKAKRIMNLDFGESPFCLVVPGKLHFIEKQSVDRFKL